MNVRKMQICVAILFACLKNMLISQREIINIKNFNITTYFTSSL